MSHAHTHTHATDGPPSSQGAALQARALRVMVLVLVPVAVWTIAGLIVLWPGHVRDHVRNDISSFSVPGVSYPRGTIIKLTTGSCGGQAGSTPGATDQVCATARVRLLEGPDKGQQVDVALNSAVYSSGVDVGQQLKLTRVPIENGSASYQFSDFERRVPILVITALFAVAVIAVARWRGLAALGGLAFAGFVLVKFLFPALISGSNPVLAALVASSAIMFVVLYAVHGFSARTTTALVGTLFGLLLSAVLGWGATRWTHLTGVSSEDDLVLAATAPDLTLTSLVICGVVVAGLGVLNDVTITQASAVWELSETERDTATLFRRAMRIGRDHIASSVYTIAFATAGASLPVLLLVAVYDRPLWQVLQTEQLSSELVRTMVAAIGLVLAMPLTTLIGVAVIQAGRRSPTVAAAAATDRRERPSSERRERPVAARHGSAQADPETADPHRPFLRARRHHEEEDFSFDHLRDHADDRPEEDPHR